MREEENKNGDEVCCFLKPEIISVDKCTLKTLPIRSNRYTFFI